MAIGDKKIKKQNRIMAAVLGAVVGASVGPLWGIYLLFILEDLWYWFFGWPIPIDTMYETTTLFVSIWLLIAFLGAISGYLQRGRIKRIVAMAFGTVLGISIGVVMSHYLATLLAGFWYRLFDLPGISTSRVIQTLSSAIWFLMAFLGAISGYFLSR